MNSDFLLNHAAILAKRLRSETPAEYMTAMTSRYAMALARPGDAWSFGYGKFDEGPRRVAAFTPLPHYFFSRKNPLLAVPELDTTF